MWLHLHVWLVQYMCIHATAPFRRALKKILRVAPVKSCFLGHTVRDRATEIGVWEPASRFLTGY